MAKNVNPQKTQIKRSKKDASNTENSQYWDDVRSHNLQDEDGGFREHPQANPDGFAGIEITAPSTPQLLMGEAISHLAGRQKECYLLTMRENKSLMEVAEILGISKGAVDIYKRRAIKFIKGYCTQAIRGGRV